MEGGFSPKDLKTLQNLICPPKDDSDTEDDLPQAGARKLGKFLCLQIWLIAENLYKFVPKMNYV